MGDLILPTKINYTSKLSKALESETNRYNKDPLMVLKEVGRLFETGSSTLEILKDVNLNIYKGESIAVVGPSGIGKSTLLHILGTLDRPDYGSIRFQSQDLLSLTSEKLAFFRNKKIGFVFQFHHLLQGFTAMENVIIPCLLDKIPKKKAMIAAQAILERVGLTQRLFHRAEELSGGEQQRVALARAIVMKPDMLLADEPTGNLDIKNSTQVHNLLMELNQELDMTLIVVTHNNELANLMKKRITIKDCKVVEAITSSSQRPLLN